MADLDWNLIRSFVAVAEAGSLSAAARQLGISQPTLGRHVAELEAALGAVLFRRRRSGYALTESGISLLERGLAARDSIASFSLLAQGASDRIAGTVRITASEIVAAYVLPQIVARLVIEEPEIEIEIVASNAVENLLRRDADIAIRMVRPAQNELLARKIADLPLAACASKSYLERRGRPAVPEDLLGHSLVGLDRGDDIVRGFAGFGLAIGRSRFRFRSDNQMALWEAIRAGFGIGFAQRSLVIRDPGLEIVLPDLPLPVLPMWLALHRDVRGSPRIRLVADFLHEALKRYASPS